MREKPFLSRKGFLFLPAFSVEAQVGIVNQNAKQKQTLVILGTYHVGTPGNNVINPEVADITMPKRQKQIAELIEKVKKFKPTKIVLECDHPEPIPKLKSLMTNTWQDNTS